MRKEVKITPFLRKVIRRGYAVFEQGMVEKARQWSTAGLYASNIKNDEKFNQGRFRLCLSDSLVMPSTPAEATYSGWNLSSVFILHCMCLAIVWLLTRLPFRISHLSKEERTKGVKSNDLNLHHFNCTFVTSLIH